VGVAESVSPIRPEMAHRYGEAWAVLALTLKFCADYRCECDGRCGRPAEHLEDGRCRNRQGEPAYGTGSKVVLTIAHLDHEPSHNERSNLMVACQGCHLHYDREHHGQTRAARLERAGQLTL
jgi:5-methylcytosine-specific restriction endonuclease McrA